MAITLTYGGTVHTLPPDLIWTDEHNRAKVQATKEWGIGGDLLWDSQAKQSGLPITLEGGEYHAWMPKSQCEAIQALADTPGAVMTLKLHDGSEYEVMFDTTEIAFEAIQVIDFSDPEGTDWYVPRLRFITV